MPGVRKLATATAMLALALAAPTASASGNGSALVVGDSLEVLTSPYLEKHLPDVPLTIDAEGGYNSYQILDLFKQSYDPSHSVIVFDAGTNDNPAYPEILAENLAAVAAAIGDRCMVVPTVHGFTVDGVDNTGKNQVVRSFAASRLGTQVPDWAGAVAAHPELMQPDDLHPIPAGADHRARLIARGVRGCLSYMFSPAPEAALASAPHLPPANEMAKRGTTIVGAIATGLAREVAASVAGGHPGLAAALAMIPIRLDGDA
jgi:lysophospholipase L1-like esterase